VLENVHINGCVLVRADNATIRNVEITCDGWWPLRFVDGQASGGLIEDVTIVGGPTSMSAIACDHCVIRRLDASGAVDGGKLGASVLLEDSYIHDLCDERAECNGAHNDGIDLTGDSDWMIRHNTMLNRNGQTAAIFAGCNDPGPRDVSLLNNFVGGGGYTVYGGGGCGGESSNYTVTGNLFTAKWFPRSGYYGSRAYWDNNSTNVWDDSNVYWDGPNAGQPVI
jgi:hypothetical protein